MIGRAVSNRLSHGFLTDSTSLVTQAELYMTKLHCEFSLSSPTVVCGEGGGVKMECGRVGVGGRE